MQNKTSPLLLLLEFAVLFVFIPFLLFAARSRIGVYLAAWGSGLYAFLMLRKMPGFSLSKLWHGEGWPPSARRIAWIRFLFFACLLTLLSAVATPAKFMDLPVQRFSVWLAVMALYPILSVIPQELFFRSFYFARYGHLIGKKTRAVLTNGVLFGFSHIVLNNWIAPTLCIIGGIIFAQSFQQHRSLKWAVIEHSLYGCWIFTVGIGWYFFTGNFVS